MDDILRFGDRWMGEGDVEGMLPTVLAEASRLHVEYRLLLLRALLSIAWDDRLPPRRVYDRTEGGARRRPIVRGPPPPERYGRNPVLITLAAADTSPFYNGLVQMVTHERVLQLDDASATSVRAQLSVVFRSGMHAAVAMQARPQFPVFRGVHPYRCGLEHEYPAALAERYAWYCPSDGLRLAEHTPPKEAGDRRKKRG